MNIKTPFPPIRFKSYEDGQAYMKSPNLNLTVASHITVGGQLVPNPEYENATYELSYTDLINPHERD